MKPVITPITEDDISNLSIGDMILISGIIYTGRDAALPKIVSLINEGCLKESGIDLKGKAIFHTAVSPAGIGPTSSNKLDIESSIPELSKAGVKIHLGKGALKNTTVQSLNEHNSVYATVPPVTALLSSKIKTKKVVAFPEQGMEAFHLLEVDGFPAIVTAAHGKTLF
ncbi:fumarate hydratase C-terminal domain-containing protein [Proteinivorax hydrogeniformans]|uniref:Fumarate hydratase C-terminal domain-containing protein n=1 Tax=Proteinivorax hydrogeniformans TaxID=1826727 RepID=A0AAU8HX16_9FIRM